MSINFDLNDLQAFRALAEHGSFRHAADAVCISQPALSRRIDKLEKALGVKLFDRTTRRVTLTMTGRVFAPRAERLLDDLDDALVGITDAAPNRRGQLTVACVPSAAYYFMPKVIAHYHRLYPNVRLKVLDTGANRVCAAVVSGEADLGLSFAGNLDEQVQFEWLVHEHYVAACRRDHALAGRAQVSWQEFFEHDHIMVDKTSGNRFLLDQALMHLKPARSSLCETRHVTTMLGMVEAGLGIAAVPTMAMPGNTHPILTSVPLVDPTVTRNVGLIKRRGRALTPAARELEALIMKMKTPLPGQSGGSGMPGDGAAATPDAPRAFD